MCVCMYIMNCHREQKAGNTSANFGKHIHVDKVCQLSTKSCMFLTFIFMVLDLNQVQWKVHT